MLEKFRKLLTHTFVYGLGNYGIKLVGFLLIPLYTRFLLPADYGVMSLVSMYTQVMFVLLNLGQSTALFRFYYDEDTREGRQRVISSSVWLVLLVSLPLAALPLLFSAPLAGWLVGDRGWWFLVWMGTATVVCKVFLRMPFAVMRAEDESKRYATWSVARNALSAGLAVLFVAGFHWGASGVIASQLVAELLMCFLLARATVATLSGGFHWNDIKEQLLFGLPFVPAGIGTFVLDLADRWFIKHYISIDEVGVYSLGYRFGEIVTFVISAVQLSWPQFLFQHRKDENAPRLYAYATTYYLALILFLCLALAVAAPELLHIMTTPPFYRAASVVPIIALAAMFDGLQFMLNVGLMFQKKPVIRMCIVLVAAAVNLILNVILIPRYGMMGAAYATLIGFGLQALVTLWISLRMYHVPYQYRRFAHMAAAAALVYSIAGWTQPESLWIAVPWKALLLLVYPLLLVATGFLDASELASVRGALGAWWSGTGPSPLAALARPRKQKKKRSIAPNP